MKRKFLCAITTELPAEILEDQINDAHTKANLVIDAAENLKNGDWTEELEDLLVLLVQIKKKHIAKIN